MTKTVQISLIPNARVCSIPEDATPEIVAGALFQAGFDMSKPMYQGLGAVMCDECKVLEETGDILYIQPIEAGPAPTKH